MSFSAQNNAQDVAPSPANLPRGGPSSRRTFLKEFQVEVAIIGEFCWNIPSFVGTSARLTPAACTTPPRAPTGFLIPRHFACCCYEDTGIQAAMTLLHRKWLVSSIDCDMRPRFGASTSICAQSTARPHLPCDAIPKFAMIIHASCH